MKCIFVLLFVVGLSEIGAVPAVPSKKISHFSEWKNELLKAIWSDDVSTVKSLIENYAKHQYKKNLLDEEVLHFAADKTSGNIDVVKYLLEIGFELNRKDNRLGFTPLARALRSGNVELAKFFIKNGADVKIPSHTNITPLHLSIELGNVELVKLLIEKGADVNAPDNNGNSALHRTAFKCDINLAEILIRNGANVNIKNSKFFMQTPLHTIAMFGRENGAEYAKLIINSGADVEAEDSLKRTPYDMAIKYGHMEIAMVLKDAENNGH